MSPWAVPLLLALPWLLFPLWALVAVRLPRELPPRREGVARLPSPPPLVSVVVPARNEAHNVGRVLGSVTASDYPRFEVLVVDDRSEDGTGELARAVPLGRAERLEVVDGEPLPEGWLGKPWACRQGAAVARGDLLLFTDADTVHGEALLARAVAGLHEDRADALTVGGRQLMGTFWERLVQPQVFLMMLFRFRDARRPLPRRRWRDAIANGQYLLFTRAAYHAIGGHEAVKEEVVEDLRLAQILVKDGRTLSLRMAEDDLATRMYRGLGELVRGWSKNLLIGGLQTVPPRLRPFVAPVSLAAAVGAWLLPPALLAAALLGAGGDGLLPWASLVVTVSVLFWGAVTARMGASPLYGLLYPLGAAVGAAILLRAWARGGRVEWKGREYRVRVEGP